MPLEIVRNDITKMSVDAIVNAATTTLLGGGGVDGAIHRAAGPQLLEECRTLNGCDTGDAKLTGAYDLPCSHVIHTVGPIVQGALTKKHERLLRSCYESCLQLAVAHEVKSIAFCCISTGVFHFPNQRAAEIAVHTVEKFREKSGSDIAVIFNVFKDSDREIYRQLLQLQ